MRAHDDQIDLVLCRVLHDLLARFAKPHRTFRPQLAHFTLGQQVPEPIVRSALDRFEKPEWILRIGRLADSDPELAAKINGFGEEHMGALLQDILTQARAQ